MILNIQDEKTKRVEIPIAASIVKDTRELLGTKGLHILLAYISWRDNLSEKDALPIVCDEFLNCPCDSITVQDYANGIKSSGMWSKSYEQFKKHNDNGRYSMYISEYEALIIGNAEVDFLEDKLIIAGIFANIIDKEWHCSDGRNNIILNGYTTLAKQCNLPIEKFKAYYRWLVENNIIATRTVTKKENRYLKRPFTSRYKYKADLEKFTEDFAKQENYEIV